MSTVVMCAASALVLTSSSFDGVVGAASFATAAFDGTPDRQTTDSLVLDSQRLTGKDRAGRVNAPRATTPTQLLSAFVPDRNVRVLHGEVVLCASRPVRRHSLRAPPVSDEDSSDADRDDDDDDDDDDDVRRTERAGSAAPANVDLLAAGDEDDRRPFDILPTLDAHLPSSFVFDVQSLRAPPR